MQIAALLLFGVTALTTPASAAGAMGDEANLTASAVLERYISAAPANPWAVESMEINASLPKLSKTGCLQAVRRLAPAGAAKWEVLQLEGDSTVRDQVIVRYLKAQQRASEMPSVSVAITPLNYKFAYKGVATYSGGAAYIFQITPRKKRKGLMKGELWLDAATAEPLRESGYLVKSPSVFIKRVSFTQENAIEAGAVQSRITHLTIDTRLIGRAELQIEERPLHVTDAEQPASRRTDGGQR